MSSASADDSAPFQPGQLGLRHLLGAMTVAAIVLGISAARLRTMKPLDAALVAGHWSIVLLIAAVTFYFTSRRRRRDRLAAGNIQLRVLCRPMTERRRTIIKWTLTALVVLDGIFISLVPYPGVTPNPTFGRTGVNYLLAMLRGIMPQTAIWEGALWGWCLSHWLANVYWVEFCEHGILMYSGFFPWKGMTRLGWSIVHPNVLVFFQRGHIAQITIDSASHAAVTELLEKGQSIPALRPADS